MDRFEIFINFVNETILRFGINPDAVFFGNSVAEYVIAMAVFFAVLFALGLFQYVLFRYLRALSERTKTDIDDACVEIAASLRPPFYSFLAFYTALQFIVLHNFAAQAVDAVLIIWITYQIVAALTIFTNFLLKRRLQKEDDATTRSALQLIGKIIAGILWGVGLLMVLSNLGINVSSLLAGVGIGGIAIAFALQNILSDLFSSFAIYFDKPFKVGDFIIVGEHLGTVEKIGVKTTRLRALQGEEIVISNKELTGSRIQNFKKMSERRIEFGFGVVYQTPVDQLRNISQTVERIIKSVPHTRFDRAHFKSFGDSSLDFEVVYYVDVPDYNKYMDVQQEINLKLTEAFEKEKIEFAYPTRTLYLNKE